MGALVPREPTAMVVEPLRGRRRCAAPLAGERGGVRVFGRCMLQRPIRGALAEARTGDGARASLYPRLLSVYPSGVHRRRAVSANGTPDGFILLTNIGISCSTGTS